MSGNPHAALPLARAGLTEPRIVRIALTGVALLFLVTFLFVPLAFLFVEAFRGGWAAYRAAIVDEAALDAIKLTLIVAAIAVPANVAFGFAAAWAVTKFDFRGKRLLTALIDLPFAVSPVVAGLIFVQLFGRQGWFGPWLFGARHQDHLRAARHRARHHLRLVSLRRA